MEETYTFSRALHLMRYGGKKMRCLDWEEDGYFAFVKNGEFLIGMTKYPILAQNQKLDAEEIMGSWVEVK